MSTRVFRVERTEEFRKAGPTDLVRLNPVKGTNALFLPKSLLEILVYALVTGEIVHLSGPSGSAKTSLIEALYLVESNFLAISKALGFERKPLKVYPIQMVTYEAPGELYQRRALKDGTTYDEVSGLVQALLAASKAGGQFYATVWLREIGRVHSASVQGGLLDLVTKGDIILPDGTRIPGQTVSWVADSNYQAEGEGIHTLVTLDDALKRRFTINLTLDYLSAEQEVDIVNHLITEGELAPVGEELVLKVVELGQVIRRHKSDGNLQSVPPPTIYGFLAFLRMVQNLPHLSHQQVAASTLLGNASTEDRKQTASVFNEVFGLQADQEDDPMKGGGLF